MCPFLNKPIKRLKQNNNRELRLEIYKSKQWRELRQSKLIANPLCEECLKNGVTKLAVDVHHLNSPFNYYGTERLRWAFDFSNLLSLCKECHGIKHSHGRTTTE